MEQAEKGTMEVSEKQLNFTEKQRNFIRKYLLGSLDDKIIMRQIEEKLLLDDVFAEDLSMAEDELIDEYLDGTLSQPEREQFLHFFLLSSENKEKLRLIQNLRKYSANSASVQFAKRFSKEKNAFDWRRLFSFPSLRFAAIALVLFLIGIGIWRVSFYQSEVDRGLAQLRLAYRGQRPTESRTTANFDYTPMSEMRGNMTPGLADDKSLRRAELLLSEAAENSSNAESHHALGLLYLSEKKYDKALDEFKVALELAPNNAKLHSDFGAALLEKAKGADTKEYSNEALENYSLALKSINRALEIDNSLLEALFNKGLVLQKMRIIDQSQEAWGKYLEKDSTSPWADEARKNLELLKRESRIPKDKSQILRDFLNAFQKNDREKAWEIISQTKELIEGVMIQKQLAQGFLEASQQSRKEAATELLSAFIFLGELENQNANDFYFAELADYYSKTNQIQQQKLLEAHFKLQKGNELIRKTEFVSAIEIISSAQDLFASVGSIWEAKLAEQRIAYCLSRLDKIKESNERLIALSELCEQKKYKWLQIMSDGWIAENYYFLGESSKSIFYNQKALKLAQEISDTYNNHRVLVQLTEVYQAIGDPRKALFFTYQNLMLTESYHTFPRQRWRDLNYASEALYRFKLYDAAAAFGEESANFARNVAKDNWMLSTSHRNLAMIYGDLKNFTLANEHIRSNLQLTQTFPNEAMRKRLFSDSTQILGDLQRQAGDCASALVSYNESIQNYEKMEFSIFRSAARKGKLFCHLAQQDDAGVKDEFAAILEMFDEDREKIKEESERNAFFDIEQSVYDAATNYAYSNAKDGEMAFIYAENSRARSLLELVQVKTDNLSQPLSLPEIQNRMPAEVQVVYYAVLTDKILIWYISNTKSTVVETKLSEDELENIVTEYRKNLFKKSDEENIQTLAKRLYSFLIEPVESFLDKNKALCIVADKQLFQLPFASLVSPQTDKYLIEHYALLSAPSATIFINETKIARQKVNGNSEKVLSIGNPTFSRKEYPELADLPDASYEAGEIARLYDSAKVFVHNEATKESIISNLNDSDVIHFAGHYVPNSTSPAYSKLLLAGSSLAVEEIMQNKLSQVRLIILSACETGTEKFYKGEGMIGAARAFLAADVPLVIASQWSANSGATAELMIRFHHYRKTEKLSTINALREAQIDLLTNKSAQFHQPFYWALFLPIGGFANY